MRFRFKTDDNLVCNKRINIPVCIISLSSVIKRKNNHYPNFKLKRCFYEIKDYKLLIMLWDESKIFKILPF